MTKPFVIGLTGSIGMGKSVTAGLFEELGVPVFSSDAAVHRLYDKGGAAVPLIEKDFPGTVHDGQVNRAALSKHVTGDNQAITKLEAIIHPLVRAERARFLDSVSSSILVFEIPLLFETGFESQVDAIVVASAPGEIQRARVLARPGMSEEKFAHLLSRQVPDDEKRAKADFVVATGQGVDHARTQVKHILGEIRLRIERASNHA